MQWILLCMCVSWCVKIPLTASSTTSTTRSICWTWNTDTHGKSLLMLTNQVHTVKQKADIDVPETHIHWSTFKQGGHVNIHKDNMQYAHGQTDTITASFLQPGLSDIDFLNATRCLCGCNTTYIKYWQRHSLAVGLHGWEQTGRKQKEVERVADRCSYGKNKPIAHT